MIALPAATYKDACRHMGGSAYFTIPFPEQRYLVGIVKRIKIADLSQKTRTIHHRYEIWLCCPTYTRYISRLNDRPSTKPSTL
jgi:hypothetical protein